MKVPMTVALVAVCLASPARPDAPLIYCVGTESGGGGPKRYAYEVDSASYPMMDFRVGTNDLKIERYTNVLVPQGWHFTVEPVTMSHIHGVKTPHGKVSPGPCRCLTAGSAYWWTDLPEHTVEFFTFGYDHPWISEDIGWILNTRQDGSPPHFYTFEENWDAPVGTGAGPVHGPTAVCPGDANLDGRVDIFDLDVLGANWTTGDTWGRGDFNADQAADVFDLDTMSENWGHGTAPAPVPEPTGLVLLAMSLVLIRRRR